MHFYRIAGALILAISGFGAAAAINSRSSQTLRQTDAIISLFLFIRSKIECFALPAADIIAVCDAGLLRDCGGGGQAIYCDLSSLFESFDISDPAVAELTRGFAAGFGRSYREEQLKECDYYIELLRERRREIAEALPAKKRVTSALCVSSALAMVILLL